MAEITYQWPSRDQARLIGKSHHRLDGPAKSTGTAKYTYDVNLKNMLVARALGCPHAHCRIKSIDTSAAKGVPGVVDVHVLAHAEPGSEISWPGELIAVVSAENEGAAAEGVKRLKVEYELLDVFTADSDLEGAEKAGRAQKAGGRVRTVNEPAEDEDEDAFVEKELVRLFGEAAHVVEGYYGIQAITHCCLEPHGATAAWEGDKLTVYLSTQNVSGTDEQFASALGITANDVTVLCEYIGGGFGCKFAPDYWGIAAAEIARRTRRPVKLMLDREQELQIAGNRPSGFIRVKLGADPDGVVTVWDSHHWGTGGPKGGGISDSVIPYIYTPPNFRRASTSILTNTAPSRAWRAPNHPQACAITQTAIDDLAAKMGADSYDIFHRNLKNISSNQTAEVYAEEMQVAAQLMDWKAKWHAHGKGPAQGSIVEGLGMAIHTWQGVANDSTAMLRIYPDGGVEAFCGTQDLGTGTRTVCAVVLAETLGLPIEAVNVNIGSSQYPNSGASGGSTTVGGVSESHRRVAHDALGKLFDLVAAKLGVPADQLEAASGRIQVKGDSGKGLSWKEACRLIGLKPLELTASYQRGTTSPLSGSGVGGVQMAEVAVDRETGVVKMKKFVAVQDMGLVINRQAAESQVYGAVIMGIAYALFEERITDPMTGKFVNANMADYRLPRLGDIGQIVVEIYEPDSQRARGVIGLGEPPVISPGAAISNAVANALGVRVPVLPMTPKRVLDALAAAERA
jgi:xanthine dehydrogenase YagR molybdenum-binding subunit